MDNHSDKCEANQMDSTNNPAACASARLSEDAHCDRQPQVSPALACPDSQTIHQPDHQTTHQPDHQFHGLKLGLFKIGCRDHSFAFGVNIGLAKLDAQIGQETRVDAAVNLGPIGAHGGAGVGINRWGLHSDVGGRLHAAKLVDTGAEVTAKLGPHSGIHADTGARVLFAHTRHTFDSSVDKDGFNNGYKGDVGLAKVVGVQAGGHANLNEDSSLGGGVKTNLQEASLGAGADIDSQHNTLVSPDVYVNADSGRENARLDVAAQVGPTLDVRAGTGYDTTDRNQDQHSGQLSFGVGQSGVGAKTVDTYNGQQTTAKVGWGPDYMSDF
jgi:hypothetical protein